MLSKVYQFYRCHCCWPYTLSFYLVLVIYWLDFLVFDLPCHWSSLTAFGIILIYYLYNLYLSKKGRLKYNEDGFFIKFLSFKTVFWGFILFLLFIFKV